MHEGRVAGEDVQKGNEIRGRCRKEGIKRKEGNRERKVGPEGTEYVKEERRSRESTDKLSTTCSFWHPKHPGKVASLSSLGIRGATGLNGSCVAD